MLTQTATDSENYITFFPGQTVKVSGIALQDSEMFSHGQLYVALSRCGENKNITILCDKTRKTKNIVYQQALTRIGMDWLSKRIFCCKYYCTIK